MSEEYNKAVEKAGIYLSAGAKTEFQIRNKLEDKGFETHVIEKVVKELVRNSYIDDISYTELYLDYGMSKGRGLYRIRQELKQRGVSSDNIEKGFKAYESNRNEDLILLEEELCFQLVRKFLPKTDREYIEKRDVEKIIRKLSNLGYAYGLIFKVLRQEGINNYE